MKSIPDTGSMNGDGWTMAFRGVQVLNLGRLDWADVALVSLYEYQNGETAFADLWDSAANLKLCRCNNRECGVQGDVLGIRTDYSENVLTHQLFIQMRIGSNEHRR